jgi:antitoxin component YwqK of YwqJK toxin-antitoxin module
MKTTVIYIVAILLFSFNSYSQKLTLSDLTNLCSKQNWSEVNHSVQARGWSYFESKKGENYDFNTITWSYAKSDYSDEAQGWLYLFTYEEVPSKIVYGIFNKDSYNLLKNSLSSNGFTLIDNEIGDNEIIANYSNTGFTLTLTTSKIKDSDYTDNSVTSYTIISFYDPENGRKNEVLEDGTTAEYTLRAGKLNGPFKTYHKNGNVKRTGSFTNAIENGLFREYDENNHLEAEYSKKDGELNSTLKTFYLNGNVKKESTFLKGIENGKFIEYNEDGSINMEYSMLNGEYNGLFKFYEDKRLSHTVTYTNGILNGPKVEYYYDKDDGHLFLKAYGAFVDDEKSGPWKVYVVENNKERLLSLVNYSDGLKNGKFMDASGDSLIFGTYKNDKLHGPYKLYLDFSKLLVGGFIQTDTSKLILISNGYFSDGLKTGYWKNYDLTKTLINEGPYSDDLKSGTWGQYYSLYSDSNGLLPYSGTLYLIENYSNDKLNGASTRYSYLEEEKYLCNESEKKSNVGDSCTRFNFIKVMETANYLDDKLDGSYELKDSLNHILRKGNYSNDIKTGEWIEGYSKTDENNQPFFIYYKGVYQNGKITGKWIKYYNEGEISELLNYKEGKLDGECILYNSINKPSNKKQFENGDLKEFIVYDSLGNNPILKFEIFDKKSDGYKCRKTEFMEDFGAESQVYWIHDEGPINKQFFDFVFYLKVDESSEESEGYRDGDYKFANSAGDPIIEGYYLKNTKIGQWTNYFYDQNVKIESNYLEGIKKDEKYLTLTNLPFSGEVIYNDYEQDIKEIREIKNGLRSGKTQYIDNKTNNILKIENYKKGMLD